MVGDGLQELERLRIRVVELEARLARLDGAED